MKLFFFSFLYCSYPGVFKNDENPEIKATVTEILDILTKKTTIDNNINIVAIKKLRIEAYKDSKNSYFHKIKSSDSVKSLLNGDNLMIKEKINNKYLCKVYFFHKFCFANTKKFISLTVMEDLNEDIDLNFFKTETEEKLRKLMTCTLEGMSYLHKKNIIHSDIKIDNIMVKKYTSDDFCYKITDFEYSTKIDDDQGYAVTRGYTIPYASREVLEEKKSSFKSDIWAVGMICYFIVQQTDNSGKSLMNLKKKLLLDINKTILELPNSNELKSFLKTCFLRCDNHKNFAYTLLKLDCYLNDEKNSISKKFI